MNEISLSEINFKDKESDWIEILVNSDITSIYKIKDDGLLAEINPISNINYILIHFKSEEEKTFTKNNTLHIYSTKSGLTGTTEQITIESDSKVLDAVCWKNSSPTKSELEDIKELNVDCLDSESIKSNQSIAQTSSGWEIFPHPTPAAPNTHTNSAPTATIAIQKGNLESQVPFSLNLDGSKSTDPDNDDLIYTWTFPDQTIEQENPPSYKFAISGNYEISLKVTDPEGLSNTDTMQITALNNTKDMESKSLLDQIIQDQKPYFPNHTKELFPSWILPLLAFAIILLLTLRSIPSQASNCKQSEPTELE